MDVGLIGQAAGLFAVTNIDDIVILAVFFGRTVSRAEALRVVAGQYVGFTGILAAAVIGALGAGLLPESAIPYLGLLPLLLGLRAAWNAWRDHLDDGEDTDGADSGASGPGVLTVAGVTFANGGDNIGVYVPVFATSGTGALTVYVTVFLVLVVLTRLVVDAFDR
jgi:cadmium resistance protein CadD (predicted permease)